MWKDVEAVLRGVPSQVLCSCQGSEGGECGGAGGGMVGSDRSEPAFCQYEYVLVVCQPAGLYFTQWRAHNRGATLPLPSLPAAKMHQLIITLAPRSINKPSRQEKQSEAQTISDPLACSVIARAQPARKVHSSLASIPLPLPFPPTHFTTVTFHHRVSKLRLESARGMDAAGRAACPAAAPRPFTGRPPGWTCACACPRGPRYLQGAAQQAVCLMSGTTECW